MPTKIKPDYKPSPRVAELLAIRYGLTNERAAEFIGHELPAFMMYWEDTGKAKTSWDTTCLNWMDRNYEQRRESQHGQHTPSQGDVFEKALNKVQGEEEEKPKRSAYRFIPHEESTETMTAEEAFEAMRKMSGVRI